MSAQDEFIIQTVTPSTKMVDYSFLYTSVEEAHYLLHERNGSNGLRKEVSKKAKLIPEMRKLEETPHLVFFRQLATPLYETLRVINLAHELGLELLILEFLDDKFVSSGNQYKRGLGKLPVHTFLTKDHQSVYEYFRVVDFNSYIGKKLRDVKTIHSEYLVDFHHELFSEITTLNAADVTVDGSKWFSQFDGAKEYYEALLSLFVCHGVLAEIFWGSGEEQHLSEKVVIPAFKNVVAELGVRPLIINYQPPDEQHNFYWDCYPNHTTDFLKRKGYIK